jgi:hypothetical protein
VRELCRQQSRSGFLTRTLAASRLRRMAVRCRWRSLHPSREVGRRRAPLVIVGKCDADENISIRNMQLEVGYVAMRRFRYGIGMQYVADGNICVPYR